MRKPKLEEMSLREKIGQTVCFRHLNLEKFQTLQELKEHFASCAYGSTWPMGHPNEVYRLIEEELGNPELKGYKDDMYVDFINTVNSCMSIPILPAIDAMDGIATRKFPGHEPLPQATGLGAARDPELAYRYAYALGLDLKSVGIRWLWSPVADNAGVFKDLRHLSADVDMNCAMLKEFIRGLHDAGIVSGAKHFPGKDPYEYRDSHFCTASYNQSFEYWEKTQGKEFQACIDAGVDSIMVGHVTFKAVDDTMVNGRLLPATLSYKLLTEQLKGKMGFKGVLLTDDIKMRSLEVMYPPEKLYVEVLRAGIDVVLGPTRLDYVDIVEKAVLSGDLPESRIDDACQRVLDMKERHGLFDTTPIPHPTEEQREQIRLRNRKVMQDVLSKGMTLTANRANFLPIDEKKIKKVKIFYVGYSDECFDNLKYMAEEFALHGAVCHIQDGIPNEVTTTGGDFDTRESTLDLNQYDLIVYANYIGHFAPPGGRFFFGDKCLMIRNAFVRCPEKSVGVSFGDADIFFNYYTAAHTFVNAYSMGPEAMRYFVKGLYGEIQFTDYAPFPLNPITRTNDVY